MAVAGDGVGISPRTAEVTIANWFKKLSELATQKYVYLNMLRRKGRIKYGVGGEQLRWPVDVRDHDIVAHVDGGAKSFTRVNTLDNAYLPMRGYESADAITLKEKLVNRGPAAMVQIFESKQERIRRGLLRKLGAEWYKDGNATGNEHVFHGMESFMGIAAQTASSELQTTSNDTYAGLSTAEGDATVDPDSRKTWTPVIVNCNRNPGSGTRAWADFADEYIRTGLINASFGHDSEDTTDLVLLRRDSYRDLLNIADDKEHLHFVRGGEVGLAKFGFKDFVEWDGVPIGWDYGIPATDGAADTIHGYGINFDYLALHMLNKKQLWECIITWNSSRAADELYFYCLGNVKHESPRYFIKYAEIS